MTYIIFFLITVVVIYFMFFSSGYIEKMGSCGKRFFVLDKVPHAGEIFCELHLRASKLISCLEEKSKNNAKLSDQITRLRKYYVAEDLYEDGIETFTINKGSRIHICVRHPVTGRFFDINTLMFILIHEFVHIMDPEYHQYDTHVPEFWQINAWVLKVAEECGVYKNIDYSKYPTEYCKVLINSNPFFMGELALPIAPYYEQKI